MIRAVQFVFFLSIVAIVLLGTHALLYLGLSRFFPTYVSFHKALIIGILFALSLSFLFASVLVHWQENPFTRAFYLLAGWWLGLMTNFLLLFFLMWIVSLLTPLIGLPVPLHILGWSAIALGLVISLAGSWNAFHPRIREVAVEIPGLPLEWQGKKVVHMTDLHLGAIYGSEWLKQVVALANEVKPEAVLITGDLYDGMDAKLNSLALPLNDLTAPRGTYFVTGNHETYLGVPEVFAALQKTNVRVLDNEVADVAGLKFIGLSYPERMVGTASVLTTLESLQPEYQGKPNILLFHAPVHIAQFQKAGINLQLAGHTHKGQIYPFGLITRLIYKGFDYGLYPMGDYTLSTSNGVGTWGPAMRIGNTPEVVSITLVGQ